MTDLVCRTRTWINKDNADLTANKTYHWIDRVMILNQRRYVTEMKMAEFMKQIAQWVEVPNDLDLPITLATESSNQGG